MEDIRALVPSPYVRVVAVAPVEHVITRITEQVVSARASVEHVLATVRVEL